MGFTTVDNVSGMFPSFIRGTATQKPNDKLVQQFIDDIASVIAAALLQRFAEAAAGNLTAYLATLGVPAPVGVDPTAAPWNLGNDQSIQLSVLERGNRYGAAAQLGIVLATYGVSGARDLAKEYLANDWLPFYNDLRAVDKNGKPLASGPLDVMFDPAAKILTPRAGLEGKAGGDQPVGVTPSEEGVSNAFGKFGTDYGRHGYGWPSPGGWWQTNQ